MKRGGLEGLPLLQETPFFHSFVGFGMRHPPEGFLIAGEFWPREG